MNSRDLFRFVPAVAAIVMTVPVSAQEAAAPANAAHPAAAVVRDYLNFVLQREWNKSADLVEPKSLESLQKDYMERIKRAQTVCSDQRGQFLNDDREAALHQDIHRPCAHHRRGVAKEDAGVFRPQRKVKIGMIAGG